MAGLYLHIPFCKRVCAYCDFYKSAGTGSPESTFTGQYFFPFDAPDTTIRHVYRRIYYRLHGRSYFRSYSISRYKRYCRYIRH